MCSLWTEVVLTNCGLCAVCPVVGYSGLDQNHGGEYASFEVLIEKFIRALRDCSISPYVVLDGGSDPTDKKLQEVTRRAGERIKRANRAAVRGGREDILPALAKVVLLQTLARLEVRFAQCYGEADREVAALAKEWRCPVLSGDSDFYVFDLPAGILPLSYFCWEDVQRSGSQSFIRCRSYNTSSFSILFGVQKQMLPAFAALAGNDYVKLEGTELARFGPQGTGRTSHLEWLLRWLRDFQWPSEALEAALGLMEDLSVDRRAELLRGLHLGMEEYQIPSSSLSKFFIDETSLLKDWGLVPQWTRLPLSQGRLSSEVLDVLLLKRKSLRIPVDRGDSPSAHLASRPLRQVMYGLLLFGSPKRVWQNHHSNTLKNLNLLVRTRVQDLEPGRGYQKFSRTTSLRLKVLLEALQVSEEPLSRLPPPLRLPVAATCYWLQSAVPPPEEELLGALLLGLSAGNTGRLSAEGTGGPGEARTSSTTCVRRHVGVSHSFNQWQSCLEVSIQLNQLLGFPLPEPQICTNTTFTSNWTNTNIICTLMFLMSSRLFEGTLVHQLVRRMKSGRKVSVENKPLIEKLYKTCQNVVNQFHTQETSENQKTQKNSETWTLDTLQSQKTHKILEHATLLMFTPHRIFCSFLQYYLGGFQANIIFWGRSDRNSIHQPLLVCGSRLYLRLFRSIF
uniref:Asteroid homolog 1 n=1 Tax=Gasterosteus aculeatus aculeatus TaxID=481459 RepID=G3NEX7_GASAC